MFGIGRMAQAGDIPQGKLEFLVGQPHLGQEPVKVPHQGIHDEAQAGIGGIGHGRLDHACHRVFVLDQRQTLALWRLPLAGSFHVLPPLQTFALSAVSTDGQGRS
jgi:hypothetical protein